MQFNCDHNSIVALLSEHYELTPEQINSVVKAFWSNSRTALFTIGIRGWDELQIKGIGTLKPSGNKATIVKKRFAEAVRIRNQRKMVQRKRRRKFTNSSNDIIFEDFLKLIKQNSRKK